MTIILFHSYQAIAHNGSSRKKKLNRNGDNKQSIGLHSVNIADSGFVEINIRADYLWLIWQKIVKIK